MKRKFLLATATALILAGCATETPYAGRDGAKSYGFSEQKIEANRFRITFQGNASTARETVENYLLYRAAELTLAEGFDHFIVVKDDTEKTTTYQSTGYDYYGGGRAFPYYGYGYGFGRRGRLGRGFGGGFDDINIRENNRYTAIAYVVMGKGPKPADVSAYNAADVQQNLESFIRRPEAQ